MQDTDLDATREMLSGMADWARLAGGGVALATFAGFGQAERFLVAARITLAGCGKQMVFVTDEEGRAKIPFRVSCHDWDSV